MPTATNEGGSLVVINSEAVAVGTGFSEPAAGSDVARVGKLVFLSLIIKNLARAAWAEKSKYALGNMVTEGGKTYVLIKAEPEAEKSKPTTDAGVHWQEVTTPTVVCTLPAEYWPAVAVTTLDGKFTISTAGVVKATYALTEAGEQQLVHHFRAAQLAP